MNYEHKTFSKTFKENELHIIKQIPKFNLTNSLTNLNFELTNSPIEKIRHSINILKINKISNRIQSSNHLNRKKKEKNGIKIKNKN